MISGADGKRAVALSSVPLWTKDAAGKSTPVDLTMGERDGALSPAAPVVPVRIAKRADGGVMLGGFGFAPVKSAEDATGVTVADKAFFANTQTDTDFMVTAVPSGAEASWVLRSEQSPEQVGLELSLPEGAALTDDPKQPTGAVVTRRGRIVARIAPPTAVDADGRAVQASYELKGSQLRVNVVHRGRDVKYPIVVDPYFAVVYGNGPNGNANTFAGWGSSNFNCAELGFFSPNPQLAYLKAGGVSAGCFGLWVYRAPGSAYVFEADFANLNHLGTTGNAVWYGLANGDFSTPPGGVYSNGNDPPFANQPYWLESSVVSGAGRRVCTTTLDNDGQICPQHVGNAGNLAYFGIYNAVSQYYSSNQAAYVYGTTLYMSDASAPVAPKITGLPAGWTNTPPSSVKVSSTQTGLGINSFGVTFPGGGYPSRYVFATACNRAYQPPYAPCPQSASVDVPVNGTVPEGVNTISADATTPGLYNSSPSSATLKVDRTPPELFVSGNLWDLDEDTTADDHVTASLDASDGDADYPSSGVARIVVKVDGAQVADLPASACGPDNCEQSSDWTLDTTGYANGPHSISYTAYDSVGLSDTETETITIQHIADKPATSTTPAAASSLRVDGAAGGLLGLGGDRLGTSVADIGDVNNDEVDDYALGAPGAAPALRIGAGAVYIIYGGQTGSIDLAALSTTQGFEVRGAAAADAAGTSVAAAGDVNGDGKQDLLIGAPGTGLLDGHAYVVFGGVCSQTIDLANLGVCGFSITGPHITLTSLLSGLPAFGSRVFGPHTGAGAPSADLNDDGFDDVVLGSPRSSENTRVASGSTYVVFGKPNTSSVDLNSLGTQGIRVDGATANDQSGMSAAMVGDVNADNYSDLLIGAPGAASTGSGESASRPDSGKAYVVYGSPSASNKDLASLGTDGYPILGETGDKLGSTVSGLGDLDSDSIDDFALGGQNAFVVTGHDNSDSPVDLADPDLSGWRIQAPTGATSDTIVAGASDLNDDVLDDVITGVPSLGRVYSIYTQDGLLDKLPQAGAVDGSAGQRSTRYNASETGDGTGSAVDAVDTMSDGRSGLIIGAPTASAYGRSSSGSAFIAASPESPPLPVPPAGTPTTQFQAPHGGFTSARKHCAPADGWQFFDQPIADGSGGLNAQYFHFNRCVTSTRGNIVKTPTNEGCGKRTPSECKQSHYRNPHAAGFNARLRVKQLVDNDTSHMELVADKNSAADHGVALPQDPTDVLKREYAWPIVDSLGLTIGYIREVPKHVRTSPTDPSPAVSPRTFRLWNNAKQYMGTANPPTVRLTVEGRPCASTAAASESNALIFFDDDSTPSGAIDSGALHGNALTVRGLLPRRGLVPHALTGKVDNDKAIDAYWAPCKRPKKVPKQLPDPASYVVPSFLPRDTFTYLSQNQYSKRGYADAYNFPGSYTPMLNYTWPQTAASTPQYPPFALLTGSPTTVTIGGLARGVVRSPATVRYIDGFRYLDPNLPCGVHENWTWSLVRFSNVYAFVPRKYMDDNVPAAPSPRPGTFNPAGPSKQILESFRPCRSSP